VGRRCVGVADTSAPTTTHPFETIRRALVPPGIAPEGAEPPPSQARVSVVGPRKNVVGEIRGCP